MYRIPVIFYIFYLYQGSHGGFYVQCVLEARGIDTCQTHSTYVRMVTNKKIEASLVSVVPVCPRNVCVGGVLGIGGGVPTVAIPSALPRACPFCDGMVGMWLQKLVQPLSLRLYPVIWVDVSARPISLKHRSSQRRSPTPAIVSSLSNTIVGLITPIVNSGPGFLASPARG